MPSSKPILGFNDLQTKFPNIAAEAYGWDPTTIAAGSNTKKIWICNLGHTWDAVIANRTFKNAGCPICSNKQLLVGFNDFQTKFPNIAAEVNGWDPTTVIAGSRQKKSWICNLGHTWDAAISHRTFSNTGCPVCTNRQVCIGFNDLQTKFPEIAAEAYGWDPATVISGSNTKKSWRCNLGHAWNAAPNSRTSNNTGCPICSNQKLLAGFNDLQTKFPNIAAEANGWDPTTIVAGSVQKKSWICNLGHTWDTIITSRTFRNTGCPICSNQKLLAGFNDLQTKFPEIAAEAHGWDPVTVIAGSNTKKSWICNLGHTWDTAITNRTSSNTGCPVCTNKQLLVGFNDLQTKFPDIAAEANGWDPANVIAGSHQKKSWICGLGHAWDAVMTNRTYSKRGCPVCAKYGFNPEKNACLYLMYKPGEQQVGITNDLKTRLQVHERNGWVLLEHTQPAQGEKVWKIEAALKKWLKKNIGVMEGTTENWATTSMEVLSLAELKARSGIETDLF